MVFVMGLLKAHGGQGGYTQIGRTEELRYHLELVLGIRV